MYKFDAIDEIEKMMRDLERTKEAYEKAIARGNDQEVIDYMEDIDCGDWVENIDNEMRYLLDQVWKALDDLGYYADDMAEKDVDDIY